MKHKLSKIGIVKPKNVPMGKAAGPKGTKTPSPSGGTRKGPAKGY